MHRHTHVREHLPIKIDRYPRSRILKRWRRPRSQGVYSREELSLKKSRIQQHVASSKHKAGKEELAKKENREINIAQAVYMLRPDSQPLTGFEAGRPALKPSTRFEAGTRV